MADSYNRRINLYINGKEVQNDMASIKKAFYQANNELSRMQVGSEEYNRQMAKVGKLKGLMEQHNQTLRETARGWSGAQKAAEGNQGTIGRLIGTAKGLLPAFGFAAILATAKAAFGQIVSATDTLGTKWDIFMGGVKGATNEFWRTLASGTFENFSENMKAAIATGREYQRVLDELEADRRALSLAEADSIMEKLILEDQVRNSSLSPKERIAAAEARIKIEENQAKERAKIATEDFENDAMIVSQQSRLSKERLMEVVKALDKETKAKAEAYNAQLEELKKLQRAEMKSSLMGEGMMVSSTGDSPRIKQLKEETAAASETVKFYADALSGVGLVTDDTLNNLVTKYNEMKNAEASALQNTRRIRSTMFSQIDELNREQVAKDKKTAEDRKKAIQDSLENAYTSELNTLKNQLLNKEINENEFRTEQFALELAHLEAMKALHVKYGDDIAGIDGKLLDKRLEFQKDMGEMLEASQKVDADLAQSQQKMFADVDAEMDKHMQAYQEKTDEQTEKETQRNNDIIKAEEALKMIRLETAVQSGMAAVENAETLEEAGKAVINSIREQIKAHIAEAVVTAALKALKNVPFPLNIVAATMAGGAASLLFNKLVPKFEAGGYTQGANLYVAGEAGTEWIAPNKMLTHPVTGRMIAALEDMRTNRLNPDAVKMFASGGYSNKPAGSFADLSGSTPNEISPALLARLDGMLTRLETIGKSIQQMPAPRLAIDAFERAKGKYTRIQNNTDM